MLTCHKGVFICSSAEMGLKPRLGFEVRAGPMPTGYFALFHLEFNMIVIAVGAEGEWVRYYNLVQWARAVDPNIQSRTVIGPSGNRNSKHVSLAGRLWSAGDFLLVSSVDNLCKQFETREPDLDPKRLTLIRWYS